MTTLTTDAELVKIREAVANDMADAVVPGLLARLDAAENAYAELHDVEFDLRKRIEELEVRVREARRDALREVADEARRRADAAAKIHSGTPTDGWLHDFANWIESRMAEEQEGQARRDALLEAADDLEAEMNRLCGQGVDCRWHGAIQRLRRMIDDEQ